MSAIQSTTTEVHNYALKVNEAFDYPNTDPVHVLDACPSSSELVTVDSRYSTGDSFLFDYTLNSELFVSNALKFRIDVPIEVTLAAPAKDPAGAVTNITEDNFMSTVFNNCTDICLSQYGLLQAMQSCQVSLNGKTLNIPTQIAECINILGQYYNSEDVAEWFPASQPDMFQNFNQYSGDNKTLKFIDEDGERAQTCIYPEQDNNIFGCKYTRGYMSRTPTFKWVGAGTDPQKQCRVRCVFPCYLPLSFGSVPDKITSLVGVNSLRVQMNMKPGMLGYLFNTKGTILTTISKMEIDRTDKAQVFGKLMFNVWGTPNGISVPKHENGNLLPYSIQFPDIGFTAGNTDTGVHPGAVKTFNMADVRSDSLPKAVYVAVVRLKNGQFKELTETPITYGLINSLECTVSGTKTNFQSIGQLSYLADTNGYDAFTDPLGRLTKGFAVKVDLTKDLSMAGVKCVGVNGLFTLNVRGTYINQSDTTNDYQLVVLTSLAATLDFKDGSFSITGGVTIDANKLLQSDFIRAMQYNYGRRIDVIGAGLWSSLKKGAVSLAKNAWANRNQIASTVGDVVGLAKTLRGGERHYSNTTGAGTPFLGAGGVSTTNFFPQGAGAANQTPDFFKRKR